MSSRIGRLNSRNTTLTAMPKKNCKTIESAATCDADLRCPAPKYCEIITALAVDRMLNTMVMIETV